jgi:hypothetical protein
MKQRFTIVMVLVFFTLCTLGQKKEIMHNNKQSADRFKAQIEGLFSHGVKHDKLKGHQHYFLNAHVKVTKPSVQKSAQEIKQRLDSFVEYNANNEAEEKEDYTYDYNGNLTSYIDSYRDFSTNAWVASDKANFTYNSGGNMTQILEYEWDNSTNTWAAYWKQDFTYDSGGNMTQVFEYDWDNSTNNWVFYAKIDYTYNSGGNITQVIFYGWDETTNAWFANFKYDFTYDSGGNMTQQLESMWDFTTTEWVELYKLVYTYNSGGNMTQEIYYHWDISTNIWIADYKYTYAYDSGSNITQVIGYEWDSSTSAWITYSKDDYSYDSNGNPTLETYYSWDLTTSQFIPDNKYDYTYDLSYTLLDLILPPLDWFVPDYSYQISNMPLTYSEYYWDEVSSIWIKDYSGIYDYTEINTTSVTETVDLGIEIFPNPVSEFINVIGVEAIATFELYSNQGLLVLSKTLMANERVDVSGLSKGIYFYTLAIEHEKQSGKLIKQ